MKKIFCGLLLLLTVYGLFSEGTGSIKGKVLDDKKRAVTFACVLLDSTDYKTLTDKNGKYSFENIPVGTYVLQIKIMGYEPFKQEIEVTPNQLKKYNFKLKVKKMNWIE